ncbi:MAG: HPr family phosphocarrier protein [Clostridia bacterium]|nr:HPr family phosphocarrier protein [Clostridia bacterium]
MTRDITITNALGMNANNSPLFVQKANSYKSTILVQTEERQVNAKSLLGVVSLGIKRGMNITLIAEGADAEQALDGLCALIADGFAR